MKMGSLPKGGPGGVELGNECAVATVCKPGGSRQVMPAGGQGQHGPVAGTVRPPGRSFDDRGNEPINQMETDQCQNSNIAARDLRSGSLIACGPAMSTALPITTPLMARSNSDNDHDPPLRFPNWRGDVAD